MKYAKNYLTQVILQLRFAPVRELAAHEMEEYGEKIKAFLPTTDLLQQMQFTTTLSAQEAPSVKTQKGQSVWRFHSEDRSKTLAVAADQFTLEYRAYKNMDAAMLEFEALWSPFREVYPVDLLTRVGLRYVNQISLPTGDALDWDGWLAKEIVASTLASPAPTTLGLARSMHVAVWQGDDHGVRFQWGINNSDYPNTITKKEFVLDYDCFTVGDTDTSDAAKLLRDYNIIIDDLFERSIETKLRDEMGIEEAD